MSDNEPFLQIGRGLVEAIQDLTYAQHTANLMSYRYLAAARAGELESLNDTIRERLGL